MGSCFFFDENTCVSHFLWFNVGSILYFFIVQKFPIPLEIKYRTGIYAFIGEERKPPYGNPTAHWLTKDNKAFQELKGEIEQNYQRVLTHIYPV